MSRIIVSTCFILFAAASCFADDAKIRSGLQPGDTASAFHVQDVTGPRKGNTLCYACAFGRHTVVNVQTRKITDEVIAILKSLDPKVANAGKIKGDSQHAFVVYLTENPDVAEKELEAIAKKHDIKNIPLTIYDELSGPKSYKLSKEAETTVMMWKENKVAQNFAFAEGGLDAKAVKKVVEAATKHLQPAKRSEIAEK